MALSALADFRAKYPMYNDMSDEVLADKLYQKFYSNMPRAEFDTKLAGKGGTSGEAPVKSTLQSAAENFLPSAGNLISGVASTAVGAAKALNPFTGGPVEEAKFVKDLAVGTYQGLKERYGNGLESAIAKDPVGVISDVLGLALGARGVGRLRSVGDSGGSVAGTTPGTRAVTKVLEADRPTPSQVASAPAPMFAGGENMTGEVERLSNTSRAAPEMRQFLTQQQAGSLQRISNDLYGSTGVSKTAVESTKQVMQQRSQAAGPLYKSAFESGDKEISVSDDLLSSPSVKSAMQTAIRNWQDNAVSDGYGGMNPTTINRGGLIKFNKSIPAFPNVQFWDYTKRALDGMIDEQVKPDGSMTDRGRILTNIKNKLVAQVDAQSPQYKAARQSWSGPSEYLGALKEGSDILTKGESAEKMAANFAELSDAAKQGYREAAVSSIINKLQSNPAAGGLADLARELKSPQMRAKISTIIPTAEGKARWRQRVNFEVKSSELAAAGLKNSATARRLAQAQQAAGAVDDLIIHTAKSGVVSAGFKAAALSWGKIRDAFRASTDREMVNILTGKGATKATQTAPTLGSRALVPFAPGLGSIGGLQNREE